VSLIEGERERRKEKRDLSSLAAARNGKIFGKSYSAVE
jgi:hypothetical protein